MDILPTETVTGTPTQYWPRPDEEADAREAQSPGYDYTRPFLYAKQSIAIFAETRFSWIEATTKAGKTSGCIVWLIEQAFSGKDGNNYWWVAPTKAVAKIAFTRTLRAFEAGVVEKNETERKITLPNGTHLWFKGADEPDSLYGEDVYAAVIDEASRMKAEAWHAVRTTLSATNAPARIIGNVKGRKNWFYKGCRRAEAGMPGHSYHKITSRDSVAAGIMSQEEIDDARANLPENVFKELYDAEATMDGSNPFGIDYINGCIVAEVSKFPIAAWGWDLAKRQDWTVGIALDAKGQLVKLIRFQASWRDTKTRIIAETKGKPALVDSTGVGDPILEDLQASGGNFEGYIFTSASKQRLMEGLAVAIQHRQIGLTAGVVINELESFEYEYKASGVRYSAPEGMHDDCVCALALAVQRTGLRHGAFRYQRVSADKEADPGFPTDRYEPDERIRGGWESQGGLV